MNFLRKFSFFNYFSAITRAPFNTYKAQWSTFLAGYFILGIGIFYGTVSWNGGAVVVALGSSVLFLAALITGVYITKTPNIGSLMPLSCRRETVYRFLSALYMALIMIGVIILVGLISFAIGLIFASIPSCNEVEDVEAAESVTLLMGTYGGIFSAAYIVLSYSAGMVATLFKKNKNRLIFLASYSAAVLLSFILIGVPYGNSAYRELGAFVGSPFVQITYEAMQYPWLCVTLVWLAAAAMLAAAVYLAIRYDKERKSY